MTSEQEAIRRYAERELVDNPPPPLRPEVIARLAVLLRPSGGEPG